MERLLEGHTKRVADCEYDFKSRNLGMFCLILDFVNGSYDNPIESCAYDRFIELWNVENDHQNFATLRGHEQHPVSSANFFPEMIKS